MRTRANFGIIGTAQTQTSSRTGGVFTSADQVIAKQSGAWASTPAAPTITDTTSSNASATIYFTAPVDTGGSPITSYTVISTPDNISMSGSNSPITVTGLTNGSSYSFKVIANNVLGAGAPSASGQLVTPSAITPSIDILIVGGGGSGDYSLGGGGGAGGLLYGTLSVTSAATYNIVVGAGGASATASPGANSSITIDATTYTSFGGGKGGIGEQVGGNGGSGGGGGAANAGKAGGTKTQTTQGTLTGYGNNGGTSYATGGNAPYPSGGGGGAGLVGGNATASAGGAGGNGRQYDISGTATYYAGGGGGSADYTGGAGGLGGGGQGGITFPATAGVSGAANTGGGGGGASRDGNVANTRNGGSGVVILRYPDSYGALVGTTGSPTITTTGGYRIYQFNGSGSITI